jgi:TolB-like protein/Tfp pilus assembly protein PilF
VHGDGVNIAARMEPLATPGGICVSEDVARQVRNKVPYPIVKLGKEKLKNIAMPMEVYNVLLPWITQNKKAKAKIPARKTVITGLLLLGALILIGAFFYIKNYQRKETSHSKSRLAVLPLSNISNDAKDEYFADGMTEEIISNLSKISGLSVIARTSVMKYKAVDKNISQIGNELMVGTILEGSVRKFQNKARITLQLINVTTQEPIWSRDYDRELKDIFMIQSEIAQNVADELKIRLVSSEKEQLAKNHTSNSIAFEEYLIGKNYLNKRTPESIQASIPHFEKSILEDAEFALPYASLAYAYTLIGVAGYGNIPRAVAETKAKEAVMKALQIDETLAEAHAALGYIKFRIDWDWKGAEKEFKRAIELKPSYATAHEWYALFLAIHVRLDEALSEIQTAYQLDPLSLSVNNGLARIYHFRNETDKAINQTDKTLALDSNYAEGYFTVGMTYYKRNEYEKSVAALTKAINIANRRPVMLGMLGAVYAKMGNTNEAKKLLSELELPPLNNDKLYNIAIIKSNLGLQDEALNILEKLADEKYGIMIYMKVEKRFFHEPNNPTYQRIEKKIGL